MRDVLVAGLIIYGMVGVGAALGIVPRGIFKHPAERFAVRLSAAIIWPFYCGFLLMRHLIPEDIDVKDQNQAK